MTHPTLSSRHVTEVHCSHLRHKGMYVSDETTVSERHPFADQIEATSFWCVCTQKAFGPDGQPVGPEACGKGRACCEH